MVELQPADHGGDVVPLRRGAAGRLDAARRPGRGEPLIRREALFQRLAEARRVTILAGPAGSGKTSLLRSWLADACLDGRAAWVTVAREERDGHRFCDSVIDALAALTDDEPVPSIGEARSDALTDRLLRTARAFDERGSGCIASGWPAF